MHLPSHIYRLSHFSLLQLCCKHPAALTYSTLHATTFFISCCLNRNGNLLGYVSHRVLCQDNKLAWSLLLKLVETFICTTFKVCFPSRNAKHHQIDVFSSRSFSARRTTMHITGTKDPERCLAQKNVPGQNHVLHVPFSSPRLWSCVESLGHRTTNPANASLLAHFAE